MDASPDCAAVPHDALVAYLYDESLPVERRRIERHLEECEACRAELTALRAVRGGLSEWTLPETESGLRVVGGGQPRRTPTRWWLARAGGLAAAASLLLVVGVSLVGVEVRFDGQGLTVRLGAADEGAPAAPGSTEGPDADSLTAGSNEAVGGPGGAPWSADLAALERELRGLLEAPGATPLVRRTRGDGPAGPVTGGAVVERRSGRGVPREMDETRVLAHLQELIAESERRQQAELALWFTEFAREFDLQRLADQQQMQQELGALEGYADYLVRVADR